MTTEEILSKLHFPDGLSLTVLQKLRKDAAAIEEISRTAYQGEEYHFALLRRMPLTRLAVVVYLLTRKYDEYKAKGIPDDVIFDTFGDVTLRASLYYESTGKPGLSKDSVIWFRHIMNVGIFKLGALQFQPFSMIYLDEETIGEPYMTFSREQKAALPDSSPVLNCHIQRGADLTRKAVVDSLDAARAFFPRYFPEVRYKAFLCYSWLLYPPMLMQLPEESNIRRFASGFTIIGTCADPEQANENLFGPDAGKKQSSPPTLLQKAAAEHPECMGFACGIITI